jgi:hypothetical protein
LLKAAFVPFGSPDFVAFGLACFIFDGALGAFGTMAARGEWGRVRGSGNILAGKRINEQEK